MAIRFDPLSPRHFPLLLKWLQAPHVQEWWDPGVDWTFERVKKKFGPYVDGYKISRKVSRPFQALIIVVDGQPIGYLQVYNPYDFPRKPALVGLPSSLLALDILMGEADYVGRGVGTRVLTEFFTTWPFPQPSFFVDPEVTNRAAIRCYEKAGFTKVSERDGVLWMIK